MQSFDGKFLIGLCALLFLFCMVNTDEDIASAFTEHEVIPDVIPNPPAQLLKITYDNELTVNTGNELTPTQVKNQPTVEYEADDKAYYTLIMTDPDAPSRADPKFGEFKHWVVANIPGNNVKKGYVLAAYVGAGPPEGTGLHRYVFLLYEQKGKFEFSTVPISNTSRVMRPNFKAAEYAEMHGYGDPIAGNFFQAQYDDYVPILHAQLSGN